MSIAITEEHRILAATVSELLAKRGSRAEARTTMESPEEALPTTWKEMADLGWLGLHLPEEFGGSGYTLEELVVVVEELGRGLATGPFVPTVVVSAVIAASGSDEQKQRWLPQLASGAIAAGFTFDHRAARNGSTVTGSVDAVLGGGLADLIVMPLAEQVLIVERGPGVTVEVPPNIDGSRRSARVHFDNAPIADVLPNESSVLRDLGRLILAAEATGVARETTQLAAEYAKVRQQFGRVIATFQAVKHHCANMAVATELATSAVWDAARAASIGGDTRAYTASVAALLAADAADLCTNLCTQVHGGIGFTYENDAHLYMRRATALAAMIDRPMCAVDPVGHVRNGVRREKTVDLPPEAEVIRDTVRDFAASIADVTGDARKDTLIDTGYAMPHWPAPWGRNAGAVEQLVITEEFAAAGIQRPQLGITGWVILTLIQHATDDQVARWVRPALRQDVIWCQLFSEPEAGSDAAGVKTRATRVDGGWLVNGQKVWTSGAHVASFGFATVRTNPDAPKHQGITTMVIDMHGEGVEVRPIKMPTGASDFNEVFFDDVFVPDDDVVGPIDGGWTVARATLGNESVSIGGGDGGMVLPSSALVAALDAAPDRGDHARVGRFIATSQAMAMMNLRSAHRAVAGGEPGPEGAITKLVLSELGHEAAALTADLAGPGGVYLDGPGAMSGTLVLMHRAMSIAGGTSEIKRNQIGERILGLPRDPLIS